jgi:hypothetical protein
MLAWHINAVAHTHAYKCTLTCLTELRIWKGVSEEVQKPVVSEMPYVGSDSTTSSTPSSQMLSVGIALI